MRILLISPNHAEGAWLQKALQESAHSLQRAEDLRDGLFVAGEEQFDAVIVMALDSALLPALHGILPGFSKLAAGATIIAVLGIEASATERSKVLRAGADACFRYPFSFIEMHERMHALLRNTAACGGGVQGGQPAQAVQAASGAQPVQNAPQLDAGTREIVEGSRRAELTRREYLLVECLMRQTNVPVPRDQMIRYAWPEKDDIDASTVNLVVSRLRRKLAREGIDVRIDTISRYGYQLTWPTFD
ncbi:response regulator transcription factor [Paraburkholderia silvatlantica]|uniref:DNA-binding response OmpR family regulator n=1 Tax=Paraburkholderia silvatlantica TaxID=321895 RepID=A0A2V4THG4_9BURK|nr:response regulator transcription factor [Paraburkholderia silvatlantica]PYE12874.1 DNA-binding response OmpR family regulator [Paraburkholderia silvatlantica]TDQ75541.1 DNA-binding response OmpR family regulator [Paraburkholderia silvatlantica]